MQYSLICEHPVIRRIDKNFVKCQMCEQTFIQPIKITGNKTKADFIRENNGFEHNFDKNFTNIIENHESYRKPWYEYYTDRNKMNKIIINRVAKMGTNPKKYEVKINNNKVFLTDAEFNKLLDDIRAIRIDERQFRNLIQ